MSDLLMPLMYGMDTIKRISATQPSPRIVVLTDYAGDDLFLLSIKAGVRGYLLKDCQPDELVNAIVDVYSGLPSFSSAMAWKALRRILEDKLPENNFNILSRREMDVLCLLTIGKTDCEIGEKLFITLVTARTHIKRIIGKLGVRNRVEVALYALRQGLVTFQEIGFLEAAGGRENVR